MTNEVREQRLQAILHAYLMAVDQGATPDRQKLLDEHPDLREELAKYFADASKLDQLTNALKTGTFNGGPASSTKAPILDTLRYFGDYELLEEIARGGMGVVFKAKQVSLNRIVALKMILKGELATEGDVRHFRREAEAAANLDHPHIVPIYEVGEHKGQQYFSMKLIERDLRVPEAGTKASQLEAARCAASVARAVHHAHQRGILHRDLKPSNVLIDTEGQPHVADFGLAKRIEGDDHTTRTGAIVGTPSYMAPEQARAEKTLTTAVDVYSMGAILFEWLTGRPPFRTDNLLSTLRKVVEEAPPAPRSLNPALDRDLETICLKCLEKDPVRRYASAGALADDLDRWLRGEPIEARPSTAWERLGKWRRRRPTAAALLGVSLLAGLVIVALGAVLYSNRLEQARAETKRQFDEADKERQARAAVEQERAATSAQLDQTRRTLMTSQILRVGAIWQRDPILARDLLEDTAICPPALREFPWRYYHRLSRCEFSPLTGHEAAILSLAVSRDSKLLASGGADGVIRLWNLAAGEQLHVLHGHQGAVNGLAFSLDGKTLYSGAADKAVKVWNTLDGTERATWNGHGGMILALAMSPDGKTLASAGGATFTSGGEARLWDVATGVSRKIGQQSGSAYSCVAFSPDGGLLAAGCSSPSVNDIWDLDGDAPPATTQLPGSGWLQGVVFGNDSRSLIFAKADNTLRVGEITRQANHGTPRLREVAVRHGHRDQVEAVALHPAGLLLASTGSQNDPGVRLWDLPGLRERTVLRSRIDLHRPGSLPTHPVLFTPDGKMLLEGGGQMVRRWAISSEHEGVTLRHEQALALAVAPNGQILATGGEHGDVKLWDLHTGKLIAIRHTHGSVRALAFSPDSQCLAAATGPGHEKRSSPRPTLRWQPLSRSEEQLHLWWNLKDERAHTFFDEKQDQPTVPTQPCRGLVWSKEGRSLAWIDSAQVQFYDVDAGARTARRGASYVQQPSRAKLHSLLAIPTPGVALVVDAAGKLVQVDTTPGQSTPIRELGDPDDPSAAITALALSRDKRLLAVAMSAGKDVRTHHAVKVFDLTGNQPPLVLGAPDVAMRTLAFSPDNKTLAGGGGDTIVRLWDLDSGQSRSLLRGHTDTVTALAFDSTGRMLVSCAAYTETNWWVWTGEVKLWVAGDPADPHAPGDTWREREWEHLTSNALRLRGRSLAGNGEREKACASFQEALHLDPTNTDLWRDRARALYRLGKYREAADDFGKLLSAQPTDIEAQFFRAGCFVLAGDEKAYRHLCDELRTQRGWHTENWLDVFVVRIHSLGGHPAEEPDKALAQIKAIVAHDQKTTWYRHALAWATYRAGHWDDAVKQFDALRMANPPEEPINVMHWLGLALAHHPAGHPEQGRPWLDKAKAWIATARKDLSPEAEAPRKLHPHDWLECQVYLKEAEGLYKAQQ